MLAVPVCTEVVRGCAWDALDVPEAVGDTSLRSYVGARVTCEEVCGIRHEL